VTRHDEALAVANDAEQEGRCGDARAIRAPLVERRAARFVERLNAMRGPFLVAQGHCFELDGRAASGSLLRRWWRVVHLVGDRAFPFALIDRATGEVRHDRGKGIRRRHPPSGNVLDSDGGDSAIALDFQGRPMIRVPPPA
jgi:hypothetical protein